MATVGEEIFCVDCQLYWAGVFSHNVAADHPARLPFEVA